MWSYNYIWFCKICNILCSIDTFAGEHFFVVHGNYTPDILRSPGLCACGSPNRQCHWGVSRDDSRISGRELRGIQFLFTSTFSKLHRALHACTGLRASCAAHLPTRTVSVGSSMWLKRNWWAHYAEHGRYDLIQLVSSYARGTYKLLYF